MVTVAEAGEMHPTELVTVNVYEPDASPVIVVLAVLPLILPGLMVQVPEGRPLSITLPVLTVHVGWVIAPTDGAEGVTGCALITILAEAAEVQPTEFVTV